MRSLLYFQNLFHVPPLVMTESDTASEYEVELDTSHSENEDHSFEERLETVMREAIVRSGWEARFELRTQGLRKILTESEEEISRVERGLISVESVGTGV